jgi:predicted PurR-regulated permease PerM
MYPTAPPHWSLFDLRRRSLSRGNLLVLASFFGAILLSRFPQNHPTLWLILPALIAAFGTFDTVRCMRKRWDFYHAGVILCIYMDLMAICMILFFLIYPYSHALSSTR